MRRTRPSSTFSSARVRRGLALAAVAVAAACGGSDGPPSPAEVVRTWSDAIVADDNEAAGELFADGAIIVQGLLPVVLRDREAAVLWNARLECSGEVVDLEADGETVTATFVLGHRRSGPCGGAGATATVIFHVRDGLIHTWELTRPRSP